MSFRNLEEFDKIYGRTRKKEKIKFCNVSIDSLFTFFSVISLFRTYKKTYLVGDVIAGFTVAAFNIPQGMAYASLASMPPVVGIYMGCFSPLIYFLFGTSRHISVATFAPVSIMVGFSTQAIKHIIDDHKSNNNNPNEATLSNTTASSILSAADQQKADEAVLIAIAASICMCSGIFLLILGLLRLGFVGSYFSVSLVKGFTFGVAFHVATSQVIKILGIKVAKYVDAGCLLFTWRDIISSISDTNLCSLTIGVSSGLTLYLFLFLADKFKSKLRGVPVPSELIIVAVTTTICKFAHLHSNFKLEIIGDVPTGLPRASVDCISTMVNNTYIISTVIQQSIPIALISFAVSLALAKLLAQKHNYTMHNSQELVALGLVDIVASFFGCYPSAASPSRSNLQSEVGGKTQLASLITSVLMFLVMLFAGPLVYSLPYSVLGAIIIVALRSFFKQALLLPTLFRCDKHDFICWTLTALLTIGLNITLGLLAGIVISLVSILWRSQKPKYYQMVQVVDTDKYREINSYETMRKIPDTLIFRFDMSLYFANADLFVSSMKKQIALRHKECLSPSYSAIDSNHHSKSPTIAGLKFVVLDAEPFNFIDHSGIIALSTVLQHCKSSQIELLISVCGLEIVEKFEREGFVDKIGLENLFPSVHDAVLYIEDVFLNRGQATSMNNDFVQLQKQNDLKEIDTSEIHSV